MNLILLNTKQDTEFWKNSYWHLKILWRSMVVLPKHSSEYLPSTEERNQTGLSKWFLGQLSISHCFDNDQPSSLDGCVEHFLTVIVIFAWIPFELLLARMSLALQDKTKVNSLVKPSFSYILWCFGWFTEVYFLKL